MIGPRSTVWDPAWEALDRVTERVEAIHAQHGNCKIVVDEREIMRALGLGIVVRSVLRKAGFDNPSERRWTRGNGAEIRRLEFGLCDRTPHDTVGGR